MSFDEQPDADPHGECRLEILGLVHELRQVREALAGQDYDSLPSDLPTVRMAHQIRAERDKFFNQVRDTCHRAERAESERDAALAAGKEGWNQFYALRKQIAEEKHPGMTNEVKANEKG